MYPEEIEILELQPRFDLMDQIRYEHRNESKEAQLYALEQAGFDLDEISYLIFKFEG